jgi:flavin-dependent dehydrogenase
MITNQDPRSRAVILGAGMAGLLAASVTNDLFDEVLIIDRDELPGSFAPRHGVPQDRHVHALLARGQQLLEELEPGFTEEAVAQGAVTGDFLDRTRMYLSGHRLRQAHSGLVALSASRPLLEGVLRARVLRHETVRVRERTDAIGLTSDGDGNVTGVRAVARDHHSAEELIPADLVLDATGRNSRAPAWLSTLGFRSPPEERVRIDVAYSTRHYRLRDDALDGDLAILEAPTPKHPRGGLLAHVEDDRAVLTLVGVLGDRPPTDPDGFEAFVRTLAHPDIDEALRGAVPVDAPTRYRFSSSRWRHYERQRMVPGNFAVIGDAMCSFNPIYGQGMTVATLEAVDLRDHLQDARTFDARRLYRSFARSLLAAWEMATGSDVMQPGVTIVPSRKQRMLNAYVTRLHASAATDAELSLRFVRVAGLVDPPEALLKPTVLWRTMRPHASSPPTGPSYPWANLSDRKQTQCTDDVVRFPSAPR